MKKLIRNTIITTIVLLTLGTTVSAAIPKIVVNNQPIESVEPVMGNGDYLVPLRKTLETMGYKVYWDNKNQMTYIFEMDKTMKDTPRTAYVLRQDNKKLYQIDNLGFITVYDDIKAGKQPNYTYKNLIENSKEFNLQAEIEKRNNQLYISLNFISEVLKEKAEFNLEKVQVEIETQEKTYNDSIWKDTVPVVETFAPDGIQRVTGQNKPNTIKYKDREWNLEPVEVKNKTIRQIHIETQRKIDVGLVVTMGEFISGQPRNQKLITHSTQKGFGIFNNAKVGETVILTDKQGISTRYRVDKIEQRTKTTADTYKEAPETEKYSQGNVGEDVKIIQTCSNTENTKVYSLILRPTNY